MSPASEGVKRALDVSVASALLVGLAPLLGVLVLAVRIDSPGPAFFRQRRLGRGGVPFRIWKFRTMHVGSATIIGPSGEVLNAPLDARHTRVGRALRRWSLDEIPQLINVLLGHMSLVGPRPDLPEALALYTLDERAKLLARPGITGLAQTSGRNTLSPRERWGLDARYAREATLWLDLRILVRTVAQVVTRRGVYR